MVLIVTHMTEQELNSGIQTKLLPQEQNSFLGYGGGLLLTLHMLSRLLSMVVQLFIQLSYKIQMEELRYLAGPKFNPTQSIQIQNILEMISAVTLKPFLFSIEGHCFYKGIYHLIPLKG